MADDPGAPGWYPISTLGRCKTTLLGWQACSTALLLPEEAKRKSISILVDAERKREGLDDLLALADYVICPAKFPQAWTGLPTLPESLVNICTKLPCLKFVIVTLGAAGCVMLEKTVDDLAHLELLDANKEYELLLERRAHLNLEEPTAISSKVGLFQEIGANNDVVKSSWKTFDWHGGDDTSIGACGYHRIRRCFYWCRALLLVQIVELWEREQGYLIAVT
ncbi:hypothetical protein L7F22_000538 [Adiantum nelumboides]|nr:hypothetical protein [Adiantum nelumboides]